jgi:outer membrane protein TolC
VAYREKEIAKYNLFTRVAQLIQQVEERYWNFTFLRQDLEEKRRGLNVTRDLLKQSEDLLRAGRVARSSVLQARAAVAEREEDVIAAESEMERFEDRLKNLLWLDLATTALTPVDQPKLDPIDFDQARSLELALRRRPEVRALEEEIRQRDAEFRLAVNQTRPRLDLVTQYTVSGLSGKPNQACVDPTSIVCVPVGINVTESVLAGKTGVRDAFTSLVSTRPFDRWSVEMRFELPLGNRAAKARQSEAALRLLEADTNLRALHDQIAEEIRNAMRETQTARKRIDVSRETIVYVENQLDGMRRQFEAGLASSYDVLQALAELDRARTAELQAIMDFNVGFSKVRFAEASILEAYNIELAEPPRYEFQPAGLINTQTAAGSRNRYDTR